MLTLCTPMDVSKCWPLIKAGLEIAVPPVTYASPNTMANTYEALLSGKMQCWFAGEQATPVAFVVTTLSIDDISGVRNLLIYALYGLADIPDKEWAEGCAQLREFAQRQQCHRIVAFSDNNKILSVVKQLGGDARYRYVTFDIGD